MYRTLINLLEGDVYILSIKNRKRFSSTLRNDLEANLKQLSDESGIPISKLLDKSIELLLKEYGNKDFIKINLPND